MSLRAFFIVLMLLGSTCLPVSAALAQRWLDAPESAVIVAVIQGMELADAPACRPQHPAWCAVAGPSTWAEPEIAQVRQWLGALFSNDDAAPFIRYARAKGYGRFWRFRTGFGFAGVRSVPSANPLWVSHHQALKGFHVADASFVSYRPDPLGGFDVVVMGLLHEVFHVLDQIDGWSGQPAFRELYERYVVGRLKPSECERLHNRLIDAMEDKAHDDGYRAARTAAVTRLQVATPAVCSGLREGFAEIAAHVALDPAADSYTPAYVADFFRTHVFPRYRHVEAHVRTPYP